MKSESKKLKVAAILLVLFGAAFVATQLLLGKAAIRSSKFNREAILLAIFSALNFIIILVLAIILARNLIKLYFERKSQPLGSRFKSKLVFTFIGLSFTPIILLSFLAYGLINKSIERWFSAPAYEILDNAADIAKYYYSTVVQKQLNYSRQIAKSLEDEELFIPSSVSKLQRIVDAERERYKASKIEIYAQGSKLLYSTDSFIQPGVEEENNKILANCNLGQEHSSVGKSGTGDIVRCGIPIYDSKMVKVIGAVITETKIPLSLAAKAYSVSAAYEKFMQLKREKQIIRSHYILVLILTTIFMLFSFAWFAIYIAKRITMPVKALAEGAEQVTKGNLDHRIRCQTNDELEILIDSFNQMTEELKENKRKIEEANLVLKNTNIELVEKRRYIETVLQNVSTGVVSVNKEETVTMINGAALKMLGLDEKMAVGSQLEKICQRALYEEIVKLMRRGSHVPAFGKEVGLELAGKKIHVALSLTPIRDLSHHRIGYVVVLDDITELISMEKAAAWQEVARRLAHEIKNPLTPIQLSAERIQKRFETVKAELTADPSWRPLHAGLLDEFGSTLEECVKTVVDEGNMLKHLINEFSQFARLPKIKLTHCDLHQVIESVLSLYNGRLDNINLIRTFDTEIPSLKLDPEQIKRAFVNLIDNALEAMEQVDREKTVTIETSWNKEDNFVKIEFADNGQGIPKRNREDLFLPYFSTKKRGTGLGLAIVRQIIKDHRGYVKAEDNNPKGAKIIIELPIN